MHRRFFEVTLPLALLVGCGKPATFEEMDSCANLNPLHPDMCLDGDGEGSEGSGGSTDGTGDTGYPEAIGPCTIDADDGFSGMVWHCAGEAAGELSFMVDISPAEVGNFKSCTELLGDQCIISRSFQPAAWEDIPEVMACCTPQLGGGSDEIEAFCAYDTYEQTCITLRAQLIAAAAPLPKGSIKNQLTSIENFLAVNTEWCTNSLLTTGVVELPESEAWNRFKDVTFTMPDVTIEYGTGPAEPEEQIECSSNNLNDSFPLEEQPNVPGPVTSLDLRNPIAATLLGPVILGSRVIGSGTIVDTESAMAINVDPANDAMTLVDLKLVATAPVSVGNDIMSLELRDVVIDLYGVATGHTHPTNDGNRHHTIDAGMAAFSISGTSPFERGFRVAANTSPLTLYELPDGDLYLDGFVLELTDSDRHVWAITLAESVWH